MKTYEGNVNYDDLNGGDISEVKGYGPCNVSNWHNCSCNSKAELHKQYLDALVTSNTTMQVNIYNIWINKYPNTTPGGSPGQSFRFEITSERGPTTDEGGALNVAVTIPFVVSTFGAARPGGSKYYKTAGVLLKNAKDAEEFLKYLEKEYLRVNGRHGKMDRGGHSMLTNVLDRRLNSYYNGSSIDYTHTNRK